MITKLTLMELWTKYFDRNAAIPENIKYLISYAFIRDMQCHYFSNEDGEVYSNMYGWGCTFHRADYGDNPETLNETQWNNKQIWIDAIKRNITEYFITDSCADYSLLDTCYGYFYLMELPLPHHITVDEFESYGVPADFKRFYNDTESGYFNFPFLIDIAVNLKITDVIFPMMAKHKGFVSEEDTPVFDIADWTLLFRSAKQLSTHINVNYPFYGNDEKILKFLPKDTTLVQVSDGRGHIHKLVKKYGYLVGFFKDECGNNTSLYKIKTSLGFSFYGHGEYQWYMDDPKIKRIKFNRTAAESNSLDPDKRIFIVYNDKDHTFFELPELNYPKTYKPFIEELLKKNKDIFGSWNNLHVFANSRTLHSDKAHYGTMFPDVRTRDEFTKAFFNNNVRKVSEDTYNAMFDAFVKTFKYDETVTSVPVITQDDINAFLCNTAERYTVEYIKEKKK